MAASVLFACGLNEQKLPSHIHISEESDIDGSFIISCILSQRLRYSNAATLLICLQQNYQHYFNAGMRLGYNLNLFNGKTFYAFDIVNEIGRNILGSKWIIDEKQLTENIIREIRNEFLEKLKNPASVTIIIDNISILMNLGASNEDVHKFCHELQTLQKDYNNDNLSIITKMSNCDLLTVEDNNIGKLGDLRIRVVKLKSGVFREVDGKLAIGRDIDDGQKEAHKEILYKVNDRNVKIYSPGEVGLKI